MQIRITSIPPGEAPEHVRKAWIGLVLPVPDRFAGSRETLGFGVLSAPRTFVGALIALCLGRAKRETGYIVAADRAIEILTLHAPYAAAWWRENASRVIAPGRHFVFARDACEEIPGDAG